MTLLQCNKQIKYIHSFTLAPDDICAVIAKLGRIQHQDGASTCSCPVLGHGRGRGDINPSLSISLGVDGQLLLHCFAGCAFENILRSILDKGLLPSDRNLHYQNVFNRSIEASRKSKTDFTFMRKIWNDCLSAKGSVVEKYLRARWYTDTIPESFRYHPNLCHKPSNSSHPAMVCAVSRWPDNEVTAIHRTYLKKDGSGKADIKENKMMLGKTKGGAVRLAEPGSKLIITEGIETGLSVQLATSLPTWAALSASGMENIIVPPLDITQEITIAADGDKVGRNAANKLANRLLADGYKVRISLPPEGMDFNDLLRRSK